MDASFHKLLGAYIVSIVGDWSFKIAIPVIVFNLTGSALLMAAAFAASFAPYVVMMPLGGVIADLLPRQKILYWGDFAAALCCLVICGYLALGGRNVYLLMSCLFALGLVSALYHPAFQGFIPSLVEREALPRANSLFTASDNVLSLLGPIMSGALVAALRPEWIIWFNAASFFVSSLVIWTIRRFPETTLPQHPRISLSRLRADLADGFRIAWAQPIVKWGTILFILENFATNLVLGNMMYFLTQPLGLSVADAGLVIGLAAAGAVLGSLAAPPLMRCWPPGPLMLACVFGVLAGTIVMLGATRFGAGAVVLGRSIIMASESVIVVTMFTLRQRVIPQQFLSRTVAITRTISAAPVPLAALAGGYMLTLSGGDMRSLIVLSALVLLVCALGGLLTPFARTDLADDAEEALHARR